HPLAAELLRLCAFLHPHAIPQELITDNTKLNSTELNPGLQSLAANPLLLDEALLMLRASSLLSRNSDTRTFEMHRLVQAVLRERCSPDEQRQMVELVVLIVSRVFPDPEDVKTWPRCQRY